MRAVQYTCVLFHFAHIRKSVYFWPYLLPACLIHCLSKPILLSWSFFQTLKYLLQFDELFWFGLELLVFQHVGSLITKGKIWTFFSTCLLLMVGKQNLLYFLAIKKDVQNTHFQLCCPQGWYLIPQYLDRVAASCFSKTFIALSSLLTSYCSRCL